MKFAVLGNDDWVELYNTSNVEVDISNYQLKKDGEDSIYVIPNGTKIAPKGLKVFNNINDGMFKISNSKSVTVGLETSDGVLIDFFDKDVNLPLGSAHVVGGSYSREIDGTGEWVVKTTNTIGEYNSGGPIIVNPYEGLVLNEICGYGTDGDKDDWVELYNNSDNPIDLQGLKLLYSNGTLEIVDSEIYSFTQSTILEPNSLHVISLKGTEGKISNVKIITVKLVTQSNGVIDTFNRSIHSVGEGHEPGGSYARIPNGTGVWTAVNIASKGVINPDTYTPPQVEPSDPLLYEGLVLNEICGYGQDKEDDWVELYNNSEKDINISSIILKKDFTQIYKVPSGTIISPNQYLVFGIKNGDFSNGISNSKAVRISLHMPDGVEIENQVFNKVAEVDDVLYGNGHPNGGSYARIPNGTGDFTVVNIRTEGAINVN